METFINDDGSMVPTANVVGFGKEQLWVKAEDATAALAKVRELETALIRARLETKRVFEMIDNWCHETRAKL